MVLDPRELNRMRPARMIDQPRPCRFCGYNLVGIMDDGVCPECGKPIRAMHSRLGTDQIIEAPTGYLQRISWGADFMLLGWLGLVLSFGLRSAEEPGAAGPMMVGAGSLWWFGLILLTRPRPAPETVQENREKEWFGLRLTARITQAFWVLAGGLITVHTAMAAAGATGQVPGGVYIASIVAMVIASVGLVAVCLFVANLGYWASDTKLAMSLRVLMVIMPFMPLIVELIVGGMVPAAGRILGTIASPVVLIMIPLFLIALCPPLLFTWCMWDLRQVASWAIKNQETVEARTERLRKKAEEAAKMQPLPDTGVDETVLPGFHLGGPDAPPPAKRQLRPGNIAKTIAKRSTGEGQPYDLAPDDQ